MNYLHAICPGLVKKDHFVVYLTRTDDCVFPFFVAYREKIFLSMGSYSSGHYVDSWLVKVKIKN